MIWMGNVGGDWTQADGNSAKQSFAPANSRHLRGLGVRYLALSNSYYYNVNKRSNGRNDNDRKRVKTGLLSDL